MMQQFNVSLLLGSAPQVSWVVRDVLTFCVDFKCAFNALVDTQVSHPAYVSMIGKNKYEGAILTRALDYSEHVDMLSEDRRYLYQTGEDHFKGNCSKRCKFVKDTLGKYKDNDFSIEKIQKDIMMKDPVLNEYSQFLAVFSPITNMTNITYVTGKAPFSE